METLFYCYKCNTGMPASDMTPYGEYDPDARRTINYLACGNCGERDDLIDDACRCDECEEIFPPARMEDDHCVVCWPKVFPELAEA